MTYHVIITITKAQELLLQTQKNRIKRFFYGVLINVLKTLKQRMR